MAQIINGQVQATFDPSAVTSSPYFVTYDWTTAGIWYSQDGTPGTFETYGGDGIVAWTQDVPDTTFSAQFFAPGQYLLEVQCVASVYSVYNGSLIASFTQTSYIGGDASDIDTGGGSGGGTANARKAHAEIAHVGGGGAGITVVPATVVFSPDSLIKLGLGAPKNYWKQVTATVTPSSQVSNVSFAASNGEVSVSSDADPVTGIVTLYITAASETPPGTMGASDCNVTATDFYTEPIATVPVLVLQPTYVLESPSSANATAKNAIFNYGDQIPPDWGTNPVKSGNVDFLTHAEADINITIEDQFGQTLDSIYDGYHVVHETFAGDTNRQNVAIEFPTGQFVSGKITDEVGVPDGRTVPADQPGLADLEKAWLAEEPTFPNSAGVQAYNNGFSTSPLPSTPNVREQTITIYGFSLVPPVPHTTLWERAITCYNTNLSNTVMSVTETAK